MKPLKEESSKRNAIMSRRRSSMSVFKKNRICNHCKLIDSGDVALYQITCPECGEIPPSRKHLYPGMSATDV